MFFVFGLLLITSASAELPEQCTEAHCEPQFEDALLEETMKVTLLQHSKEHKRTQRALHDRVHGDDGSLGYCEGTTDEGRKCPPEYYSNRPCPPGCTTHTYAATTTSTTTAATTASTESQGILTWTTANDQAYTCSEKGIDYNQGTVVCAQTTYQDGVGGTCTLSCPAGTTLACIPFASGGKVGGSCGGDEFYEDADGWGYMDESTGSACIGQESCSLEVGDGTVNGTSVDPPAPAGNGKFNFKTLAVCM